MADKFIYGNSEATQETDFDFTSRQFAWVGDSNGGSYNSQVVFDLSPLSNSGKWVDWTQTNLCIPLVLNLNAVGGTFTNTPENVFAASLKGLQHLVNSMSVEITNNQVINLCNYLNHDINFRILSTSSKDTEKNFFPSMNMSKDTAESITMAQTGALAVPYYPKGFGEINNVISALPFNPTNGWTGLTAAQNAGRLQRMLSTSFDPTLGNANVINTSAFTNQLHCTTVYKNTCIQTPALNPAQSTNITYNILATIPLRMLHDIFRKLPLAKGVYMRLVLNLNCNSSVSVGITAGANPSYNINNYSSSSPNNVIPFMLSPLGVGSGFVSGTATSVVASLGIAKYFGNSATPPVIPTPALQQCRVYAALYEFSPMWESKYISSTPVKSILYNDILCFQTLAAVPNVPTNQILSNGISRPRYLLGVPMIASGVLYGGLTAANVGAVPVAGIPMPPMSSPFSSAPTTTCPQARLSQFQVMLSGSTVYQEPYTFGFQQYLQEIRQSNSLNGGLDLACNSGLLSQSDWENGYGFIYVDLSRKSSQANDDISRSIQVLFTNSCVQPLDIFWIVGYEREIKISTSCGNLVI